MILCYSSLFSDIVTIPNQNRVSVFFHTIVLGQLFGLFPDINLEKLINPVIMVGPPPHLLVLILPAYVQLADRALLAR